ncbi:glycosyltransferase [Gammaproteobacteria bacterium]|nr:glycosyltransferase [Gammaproteobacteria bacterium]
MTRLVSILMPAYNSARFINESISSVIDQTYDSWELIICDDGSNDATASICSKWSKKDNRIKVISNSHQNGASGARNSCLDHAKGSYIAFLDSDDLWFPNKLELQIDFMSKNEYIFIYSYHNIMSEDGEIGAECLAPGKVNSKIMNYSNFIPCLTVIYDSLAIGKMYQPYIRKRNDFALWLKILNSGKVPNAYCFKKSTAAYRVNSYGLSSNKIESLKYFYKCIMIYGNCNRYEAMLNTTIYLAVVIIKKKINSLYNFIVIKINNK